MYILSLLRTSQARAKEALNLFVWGQVWVKWTSTGNIMCIPTSNIEEPTQGRDRKCSMVSNVEDNQKKQQKDIATGNALSPVILSMDTPPTPPF